MFPFSSLFPPIDKVLISLNLVKNPFKASLLSNDTVVFPSNEAIILPLLLLAGLL